MSYDYSLSDKSLQVMIGTQIHPVARSNANWEDIKAALDDPNMTDDVLLGLITPRHILEAQKDITVDGNAVYWGEELIHGILVDKLLKVLAEGFNADRWINFAKNVYLNPGEWARDELYLFLEKHAMSITSDGCFNAWKVVDPNYKDCHTHRIDNTIGQVVSMPREQVDSDRAHVCSTGFHFCSAGYIDHFRGGHLMIVKINPADVVAIPKDYSNAKGRCWRYEVVGEVEGGMSSAFAKEYIATEPAVVDYNLFDPEAEDNDDTAIDVDEILAGIEPVDPEAEVTEEPEAIVIHTANHGDVDKVRFLELVEKHGSLSGIAKKFNMSAGTISAWKARLFPVVEEE